MPELRKGDKVIVMDGNRKEAPDITDYFIIHRIEEHGDGKLIVSLKFQYKTIDRFLEAKARNKELKGGFADFFYWDFHLSRREAYNKFRRVD